MRYLLQFLAIALVLGTLVHLLAARFRQAPQDEAAGTGISNGALVAWVLLGSALTMAFLLVLDQLLG